MDFELKLIKPYEVSKNEFQFIAEYKGIGTLNQLKELDWNKTIINASFIGISQDSENAYYEVTVEQLYINIEEIMEVININK